MVQISVKSANLQQNLCNKPRGSGEGEICGFLRFEGHFFSKSRNLQQNLYNKPRGSGEERFTDFQGSDATGPDFSEKRQVATKPA